MSRSAVRLALVAIAIAWFSVLDWRPLYRADESRYAEIAREMVADSDWVTPRLNGFKYFEKPPLQYWATAAAFEVFGAHNWSARLWGALTGFAGLLVVLAFGARLFEKGAGRLAALVLAGSPLYVLAGQVTTLDMSVSLFLSIAVLAFALAQSDAAPERARRGWMLAFWAGCALATLSKGLIGIVLPAGVIALYVLVRQDWRMLTRMSWGSGLVLFLLVTAPWFLAVSRANAEFAQFFFYQEHFQRFVTTMHHRDHPAWYFVPVLALGMAPWLLALGPASARALRETGDGRFRPKLFLMLWVLVVFGFFSASSSKLPAYILPILPVLALLVGEYLTVYASRRLLCAQAVLVGAIGIALVAVQPELLRGATRSAAEFVPDFVPWLRAAGACALAGAVVALALIWRGRSGYAVAAVAFGAFAATLLSITAHRVLSPAYTRAGIIEAARPAIDQQAPFFAVLAYDHTMPWELRRTVTMVGTRDELGKAIDWEPHKFIPDLAAFARAWQAAPRAGAIFDARDFDEIRRQYALPLEIVARDVRHVIVRKP